MAKRYNEKRQKQMEAAIERELSTGQDKIDLGGTMKNDLKASAMGGTLVCFSAAATVRMLFGTCHNNNDCRVILSLVLFEEKMRIVSSHTPIMMTPFLLHLFVVQREKKSCLKRK